jgi:hypothetical protein
MREPPTTPALSFPASLAERRSTLAARLADRATPTEATLAVRELLDELLTLDLSRRSPRQRQVDERAVRIVRESAGLLQAVRATAHWAQPIGQAGGQTGRSGRPGRPWRVLGLVAVQLILSLGLTALLFGAIQRGAAGGDAAFVLALVLAAGLVVLQGFTGYRLLARPRAGRQIQDDRPEIALSVDGQAVLSTLTQALLAVDQLEQAVAAPAEETAATGAGLADYPEVLRAIQQVYAARRSDDPRRAQQRAEGLRASLEQYGLALLDEWTRDDPPPPELFTTQRSLDPSSTAYRVILPAVMAGDDVIVPGRIAAPADRAGAASAQAGRAANVANFDERSR